MTKGGRFPLYEQLWLLNRHYLEFIAFTKISTTSNLLLLRNLNRQHAIPKNGSPYYLVLVEEVWAPASVRGLSRL